MSDKKELLRKLKALAERGEGGEATTAAAMLAKMMKKYGFSERDLDEQKINRYEFRWSKPFEEKLLSQIIYMVMGDVPTYRYTGSRRKTKLVDCTAVEKIEIEAAFEFYRYHLAKGLENYYQAFVQREELFPDESKKQADIPTREVSEEELLLAGALIKHTRYATITDGSERRGGNNDR